VCSWKPITMKRPLTGLLPHTIIDTKAERITAAKCPLAMGQIILATFSSEHIRNSNSS